MGRSRSAQVGSRRPSAGRWVAVDPSYCRRGHTVAFAKANRVLADLSGGLTDGSWLGRLRRWARPGVLVIEDFGLRPFTAPQADDFYELVCEQRRSSFILRRTVNPLTGMGSCPTPLSQKGSWTAS